jgi:hypothetical protein
MHTNHQEHYEDQAEVLYHALFLPDKHWIIFPEFPVQPADANWF